jgi:hypothetical protein
VRGGPRPVVADDEHLASLGVRVVRAPVAGGSDVFRHEPARLAEALMRIARR